MNWRAYPLLVLGAICFIFEFDIAGVIAVLMACYVSHS